METWKPIKNYEGYYEASNLGNIRSVSRNIVFKNGKKSYFQQGRVLKQSLGRNKNYLIVGLSKNGTTKTKDVHRIIAETFCNGEKTLDVDHIDGVKTNNKKDNLRFLTTSQNLRNHHTRIIKGYVFVKRNLKKPYQGQVSLNGKRIYLGMFETANEATFAHKSFLLANQNTQ